MELFISLIALAFNTKDFKQIEIDINKRLEQLKS